MLSWWIGQIHLVANPRTSLAAVIFLAIIEDPAMAGSSRLWLGRLRLIEGHIEQ